MKLTISPTLAWPCICSQAPTRTMVITAIVLAARVITFTSAHQFSTGNCRRISASAMSPNCRTSADSRVKDCTTRTLASASCAVPASEEL